MNEIMNPKIEYLDRANTATSVLALLAAASAAPGAISLYRFMIDAQDQKIEVSTLLGVGNRTIPGLGLAIQEPYVTLSILILAVLIPLLIFLFLLAKKSGLKKGKLVGRGLYWFIILAGIIGTLIGLGLFRKILQSDFSDLTSVNTDPASLFIAGVSVVSIIVASVAIGLVGKADIAPEMLTDEEDEDLDIQVLERGNGTFSTDHAIVSSAVAPEQLGSEEPVFRTFAADPTREKVTMDSFSEEPRSPVSDDELIQSENKLTAFHSDLSMEGPEPVPALLVEPFTEAMAQDYAAITDPAIETAPVLTEEHEAGTNQTAAAIMERDLGMSADTTPQQIPDRAAPLTAVTSVSEEDFAMVTEPETDLRPSGPVLVPAARAAAAQDPAPKPKEREIKRKLVSFPGDDTKVIVVLREYVHGRFVREWSEIRLKSDFTRPRGRN